MKPICVRFAPSPTGYMHVGNVRTALFNWLFAKKNKGTMILRIEDTDQSEARLIDPRGEQILKDLAWLGLTFDQGPFYQSERNDLYQKYLNDLIAKKAVYRCFCSAEELERKRCLQCKQGLPPRYDRTCMRLKPEESDVRAAAGEPFIWRLALPLGEITIHDLARGDITFNFFHFSDCSLTRPDGSITFLFANFVDDVEMGITHVIRGEDHLTNTAHQAYMYQVCGKEIPTFFHLPLLCNKEGKKLSKREFGTALKDLKEAGYLPQAILNYLGILGLSLKEEIVTLEQLIDIVAFDEHASTGTIGYDTDKLRWVNHKWIQTLPSEQLWTLLKPYISATYPSLKAEAEQKLHQLSFLLQTELHTLAEFVPTTTFLFTQPQLQTTAILQELKFSDKELTAVETVLQNLAINLSTHTEHEALDSMSADAKKQELTAKQLYSLIRYALTGSISGISVKDLIHVLGTTETIARISNLLKTL